MLKKNRLLSCLLLLFATVIAGCNGSITPPNSHEPTSQADCDALVPSPNPTCIKYTFDNGACVKSQDQNCSPPKTDECGGPSDPSCPSEKPFCLDNGKGQKTCQAPTSQADCDALVPSSNPTCVKYTFDNGVCRMASGANLTTSDSCCPAEAYADTDIDCPKKCTDGKTCAEGEVCTADSNGTKICQPPKDDAECKALKKEVVSATRNTMCVADYTFKAATGSDPAKCVASHIDEVKSGDGCCPAFGVFSDKDSDCPSNPFCDDSSSCAKGEVCKASASGLKYCQAPKDDADCKAYAKEVVSATGNTLCLSYSYQAGQNSSPAQCVPSHLDEVKNGDGCCPAFGVFSDKDSDCPSNPFCVDSSSCAPGEVCKAKTNGGPKYCQAPKDDADCKAYAKEVVSATGNTLCLSYSYQAGQHSSPAQCVPSHLDEVKSGDGCCPVFGVFSDKDSDCPPNPFCDDSSSCAKGEVCKANTNSGLKYCQAPASQADCDALEPSPNPTCMKYTFDNGVCKMATGASLTTSDSCCPVGAYADTDIDCPKKCTDGKTCAEGEVCTEDSKGVKICQAPKDDADCKAYAAEVISATRNTLCLSYSYQAGQHSSPAQCVKSHMDELKNGDGCCPAFGVFSDKDSDCPKP